MYAFLLRRRRVVYLTKNNACAVGLNKIYKYNNNNIVKGTYGCVRIYMEMNRHNLPLFTVHLIK